MKQKSVAIVSLVLLYIAVSIFGIGMQQINHNRLYPEVQTPAVISQKKMDIEMLHQFGYISAKEWKTFSEKVNSNLSLEEYNSLLDSMLFGREEELMESYAKLEETTPPYDED